MSNLHILTDEEQLAFDQPPFLPVEIRTICFAIDNECEKEINKLRTATNKVGFLLQFAYFKACKRFFFINRFRQEDTEYAARLLGVPIDEVDLASYKKKMPIEHRKKILGLLSFKPFEEETYAWLQKEISREVERQSKPKQIFIHAINLLIQNKIEIPSYHRLAELITIVYSEFENTLLTKLSNVLKEKDKEHLDTLLDDNDKKSRTLLYQLKIINQSTKPKAIQASSALFNTVKDYFLELNLAIAALNLSSNSIAYYATWVQKAKLSQLKQFPLAEKRYLHLLAFIQHQFYLRQDYFIDVVLKCVQSTKNSVNKKLTESDQMTRSERRNAVRHLTQTNRHYRCLIDEIRKITQSALLTDKGKINEINSLLDEHAKQQNAVNQQQIEQFEKSLDHLEKNKDYFDILEKASVKLQLRISGIVKALIFNEESSDKTLISAIEHFSKNDGQIKSDAPIEFLTTDEHRALFDENNKIRKPLYKTLLFMHIAAAIKSGELNLKYSYRYKAIHEYLIDKDTWVKSRSDLIKSAQLENFVDYKMLMEQLKQRLEEKYKTVNLRLSEGRNPYLSFNKKGRVYVTTPALEEKETKYIAALLKPTGFVPALQILSDIDKVLQFTDCFKHHSVKHVKQLQNPAAYFAGIIGLGCNIGVRKMGQISLGINENTLVNIVNWHFSLSNLQAANESIVQLIHKLSLSSIFIEEKLQPHSSSDGRKVNVSVDSLIASRSFKYHGKEKGVSVYTFIDERQALFHSLVMSSAEREAAYVIDGILQNEVTKTSIHSTDTHGFTEIIFAATHFLDVAFAPRIKNLGEQQIYAFSSKETYEKRGYKILPNRSINQKLIAAHWDDILRFMVTIKLKGVTASQLFKRLSSYAKDNPLYQALKEFGRIIKSLFILTYFDDVRLRQRIEKQLNRIELSNKFSNAVFFANDGEFNQATPEEQQIAVACKVLIQNAIVLWNYLYLSQLLANCSDENERNEIVSMIKNGSVITWRHINLHGEYDFRRRAANDSGFDMSKILSLKVA